MARYALALGLVLLGCLPAAAQTTAPAFDCSGDLSRTEKAICANDDLAAADVHLNDLYHQSLSALDDAAARDRLKAGQKAFLKARNECEADKACILAAYQARMGDLTDAEPAPDPTEIRFQYDKPVAGYHISGLWFPVLSADDPAPSGPAIIRLTDVKTGEVVQIAENALSLLDENASGIDLMGIKDVLHLTYDAATAATRDSCRESKDTCLWLGQAPIDLQDLDFDGRPELVIAHKGAGQRGASTYSIYAIPDGIDLGEGVWGYHVFARIDELTAFNLSKREIVVENSSGACNSSFETYALDTIPAFSLSHYQVAWTDADGECNMKDYKVDMQDSGVVTYTEVR